MHYGVHCYILTERWSDACLGLMDTVRQLGADCLEIAVGDDVEFGAELTRRGAEASQLKLSLSPGGLWPEYCDLSSDSPFDRRAGMKWHRRWINLAAEVGAVAYTGALYGRPGIVRRRVPPRDEMLRTAESLHMLAEYGVERGVAVVIEPMSHFRTHLINTAAQAMQIVELVGHGNLGVLLDTYHMVTEERDYGAAIRRIGQNLWGIHACENDRGIPGGGLVPWTAVGEALASSEFDGYLMLEAYNSSLGDFAFRRGMFHNVCPDGENFIRLGLSFLRNLMKTSALPQP